MDIITRTILSVSRVRQSSNQTSRLTVSGHTTVTEAFDHHLDHRLHGLAREAVEVDAGILELRRKVPADINDFEETLALVREQCEWTSPEEDPNEADSPAQSKASHAGANQSGTADGKSMIDGRALCFRLRCATYPLSRSVTAST